MPQTKTKTHFFVLMKHGNISMLNKILVKFYILRTWDWLAIGSSRSEPCSLSRDAADIYRNSAYIIYIVEKTKCSRVHKKRNDLRSYDFVIIN